MYVIYNPRRNPPRVKHNTYNEAAVEAQRLARLHPGEEFHIMMPVGHYIVPQSAPIFILPGPLTIPAHVTG